MRAQVRHVGVLARGVDDEEQVVAEIRHHQVIEDAAIFVGELGIALAAGGDGHDVLRHRLTVTYEAEAEDISAESLLQRIFDRVKVP